MAGGREGGAHVQAGAEVDSDILFGDWEHDALPVAEANVHQHTGLAFLGVVDGRGGCLGADGGAG